MAIAPGVSSKGRSASASTIATSAVTTQASGSTFLAFVVWTGAATFTSFQDSKSNGYNQIGSEITIGGSDHMRAYLCINGTGGASHTHTLNLSTTATLSVEVLEITGGDLVAPTDKVGRTDDTSSPFTTTGLLTTSAIELLVTAIFGNSGSNPGTMAETGLAGSARQTGAEETNGSTFWCGSIATVRVTSTSTYTPSWTQSGASACGVWLVTMIEAGGGGGVTVKLLAALGAG